MRLPDREYLLRRYSGCVLAGRIIAHYNLARLFPIPVFVAAIETLVIGLTDDAKWDQRHNARLSTRSQSKWPLVVLLVLTLLIIYTGFITSLARAFDLIYTGGSFG